MAVVRAKMEVIAIAPDETNECVNVSLEAVVEGSEENKSFSKYTPAAHLNITISNETAAAGFFEQGKEYYLDFTPAE